MPRSGSVRFLLVEVSLHPFSYGLSIISDIDGFERNSQVPTSSRFDCFCRLALRVEVPLSLCMAELACDSSFGRGMFDGLFSKTGSWPLPCPRPGVPLNVPPAADMLLAGKFTNQACSVESSQLWLRCPVSTKLSPKRTELRPCFSGVIRSGAKIRVSKRSSTPESMTGRSSATNEPPSHFTAKMVKKRASKYVHTP